VQTTLVLDYPLCFLMEFRRTDIFIRNRSTYPYKYYHPIDTIDRRSAPVMECHMTVNSDSVKAHSSDCHKCHKYNALAGYVGRAVLAVPRSGISNPP
jgi:hypothetical protein